MRTGLPMRGFGPRFGGGLDSRRTSLTFTAHSECASFAQPSFATVKLPYERPE
jgi:hypothetical protein